MKRVYMAHAGHFIGGDDCSFHLNTYIPNPQRSRQAPNPGWIVSTVGEYRPSAVLEGKYPNQTIRARRDDDPPRSLGFPEKESMYETMVFKAKKSETACCPYRMESGSELDCKRYADADAAAKGHEAFCRKWERKKRHDTPARRKAIAKIARRAR